MADPLLGEVAASVWDSKIGKKPTDNIFTSRALFYTMGEKGFKEESSGGKTFEMSLEFAENTTHKSQGEFDQLDTTRIPVFDAAQYNVKITAGTVVYSELEKLRAAAGNRKFDVIAEKLQNGRDSHIASLNRQAWSDGTGNGSQDIGGLQHVIASTPTSGTVGGINRGTFAFWRNRQNSGAKSSAAFDNLRSSLTTTYNQCSLGGVEATPTAVITTRTVLEGYEGTLTSLNRYLKEDRAGKSGGSGDAAFLNDALMFKNIPIFYDEDAPSGNAYLLNPKFLKWVYYEGGWMKMYPAVDPANQLANIHKLATFSNLAANGSRHLGVVTSIT